jgi:hypothetical protein
VTRKFCADWAEARGAVMSRRARGNVASFT